MKEPRNVLCCDGPYNDQYVDLPGRPYPGYKASCLYHDGGHYECVEWPETKEIVAYWRPDEDASD